ncbi:MAG: YSC84-related protein [Acidiferrobacterales bacterium]
MKKTGVFLFVASLIFLISAVHNTANAASQKELRSKAYYTVKIFKRKDPGISRFFRRSYAYAVFPTVGKGGIGIGGAYGKGAVYRNGRFIGTAKLVQISIGFQLGGQAYREVIFFQTKSVFRRFVNGKLKLGAQVSAVAAKKGAAASAAFDHGIAVFTMTKGGLMYEATVAGQSFKYKGHR